MNAANPQVKSIFGIALGIDAPTERAVYLEKACGGNEALRSEVESLLAALEGAGDFLKQSAAAPGATVDQGRATDQGEPDFARGSAESKGSLIGPYKLLQQLGEGGMGTVWMAEQMQPVQRKVALKIIKTGMDSRQVLARFEAERQALALMDHPNIAKVFDGGTTAAGRPYFVMELVKGQPITTYCDEHRLMPRQRLELFISVCQAIQHAHQKGIIHRDIKPNNVQVAPYDGKPVVKVIDFGVAKATGQRLTEQTLFTEFGAVVGTLEYMSPEQAELNNQDIDTRSDLYSLGVLLYEMLTGTTPLSRERLKKAAFTEMLRMIREEEPPRPSTRLSDSQDSLPSISAQRHMEPAKLTKLVRGELDWIVMKALEKDRGRRYESANGFAIDVQRYLADEPVQACPPSTWYRLRKLMHRHRGPVIAGSLVLLALVAGVVGTTVSLLLAVAARDEEARQRKDADTARKEADLNAELALAREKEAAAAREEAQVALARSWLGPIGLHDNEPLIDAEILALWQVAEGRGERQWDRFVRQALRTPETTRQLRIRAGPTLYAAIGLDPERRAAVELLLLEKMQDSTLGDDHRTDVALAAVALENQTPASTSAIAAVLLQSMSKTNDAYALSVMAQGVSALTARLEAKQSARVSAEATAVLVLAMSKTTDPYALNWLAKGLKALVAHMQANEAARVSAEAAAILMQAMSKTSDYDALNTLSQGLSEMAGRLESQDAARTAAVLTQAISSFADNRALYPLSQGLSEMAKRLDSQDAAATAAVLIQAISKTTDPNKLSTLLYGLTALAGQLGSTDAAATAAFLTQTIRETTDVNRLYELLPCLSAVAVRLETRDAAATAAFLGQTISKTNEVWHQILMARGLSALAAHMEAKESARVSAMAAAVLAQTISKTTDAPMLEQLALALTDVTSRLEPEESACISAAPAAALAQAISKTTDANTLKQLAQGLSALAARMEAKESARVSAEAASVLVLAMSKTTNTDALNWLESGLSAVAGWLEPKDAAGPAAVLVQTISKTADPYALSSLARGASALSARLEAKESARLSAEATSVLVLAMSKTTVANDLNLLAVGLSSVAEQLESRDAAAPAAVIVLAMSKTNDSYALNWLAQGLAMLTARLDFTEAAGVSAAATAILVQAMSKTTESSALSQLAKGLMALGAQLEPKDLADVAATLIWAISKTNDRMNGDPRLNLTQGLLAVLNGCELFERSRRAVAVAGAVGILVSTHGPIPSIALLNPAVEPLPCRFSTQKLVDLLKQPTCQDPARRVILDQLGNRYGRRFDTHWDFIRYAEEQKLNLDFTTPPKRPERKLPPLFKE